jgi:glucosamine-6-phosphate deaminase
LRIHVFDNEHLVARALAERVASAITARPSLVLGLPTGRTPIATYAELRRLHKEGTLSFKDASTFNLDEFVGVDANHPASYRQFMEQHLFEAVDLRPERIHFLDGMALDLDAQCERYERDITAAGGIDLQLLGIGSNGHIGFNEPGDELMANTHRATLHEGTRRDNAGQFGGDLSRVPREALSMGMGTIMKAAALILIATGERKARCIERMVHGPVTTRLPASFLQMHRAVEIYLDHPAASLLSERAIRAEAPPSARPQAL